jgi:hypothetical protein
MCSIEDFEESFTDYEEEQDEVNQDFLNEKVSEENYIYVDNTLSQIKSYIINKNIYIAEKLTFSNLYNFLENSY